MQSKIVCCVSCIGSFTFLNIIMHLITGVQSRVVSLTISSVQTHIVGKKTVTHARGIYFLRYYLAVTFKIVSFIEYDVRYFFSTEVQFDVCLSATGTHVRA